MEPSLKMECKTIKFSSHAIRRMFEREISKERVVATIKEGEIIERYPDDKPYPTYLLLSIMDHIPLHVVLAFDGESGACYVITVYHPNQDIWMPGFKTRRKP